MYVLKSNNGGKIKGRNWGGRRACAVIRVARTVGGTGDSGVGKSVRTRGVGTKAGSYFERERGIGERRTSPDFGVHNCGGFGFFLSFSVCHDCIGKIVWVCELCKQSI